MRKPLYFLSFLVLPLLVGSCSYQPRADYNTQTTSQNTNQENVVQPPANTNVSKPTNNTNQTVNTNINTNTNTNINANVNTNTNVVKKTTVNVSISDFAFSPQVINIRKGDSIIWTNQDLAPHTITSDSSSAFKFSSSNLNTGEKYQLTFDSAGTFGYYCAVHPSMKAQVIVSE